MRHFNLIQWSDYVRGLKPQREAAVMRRHLESGCGKCCRRFATLDLVCTTARSERLLEVPDGAIRSVEAMFQLRRRTRPASGPPLDLRLVFDSALLQAAPAMRGDDRRERQLLYELEGLSLDLRLTPVENAAGVRLAGELIDADKGPLVDIPVFLTADDGTRSQCLSGSQGYFELDSDAGGGLRLRMLLPDHNLIDLEIPEPSPSPG